MENLKLRIRKWGNSFGVVLPKKTISSQELREGQNIIIKIESEDKTKVRDIFGILKGKIKKPTGKIMKEVDKDFWEQINDFL